MNIALKQAFKDIRREDFIPQDMKPFASLNEALPIGFNQTISQPEVVRFMLEKLNPEPGQKIMDIGAGSGWTTALLAKIAGTKGKVIAIEIIPQLAKFGEKNVASYGFIEKGIVKYLCQDGSHGYPEGAPYDRILVSASLSKKELPNAWKEQLARGGKIVAPIKNSIWVFTKNSKDEFQEEEYPGFAFVPFV
ncbi:MAG: protein-L-isoaspartate O-methyltransferase [Candidatus Wildermuthbacteria bacterium]|nr:protein-L-isoaspartate O-methyltransferase [Candidatus Wildermuthbacteria bacterium]